ncbi:hypothetical protein ABZY90_14165 [Streptomyces sp. NPDC006422]|uniref:hypothetical protein n=1 Tax=unclassified Streptomyces TaxID=2593676 RepID=UPI0033BAED8F
MTDTAAWERHRERRSYVYRRARGWIIGGVFVFVALKSVLSIGGSVGWHVTPVPGTGTLGVFTANSCAPAASDGHHRCTGTFTANGGNGAVENAVLMTQIDLLKGAVESVYRAEDGTSSYANPGQVTASQLAGAAAGLGAVSLLLAAGTFFLATGYMPRPRRTAGEWYRWGRVSFHEAWRIMLSRRPALWTFGVFAALGPVLLGTGLLVAFLA